MTMFRNILYVVNDIAHEPSTSLSRAITLAESNQANLTILYVIPQLSESRRASIIGIDSEEIKRKSIEYEVQHLNDVLTQVTSDISIKAEVRMGKRHVEAIRFAQMTNVDLVAAKADGFSWLDRYIGSDNMHLLRKCPAPVWLIKNNEHTSYKQIVASVDFDDDTETRNGELNVPILDWASSLALTNFAALHVVNAYDVPEAGLISMWSEQPEKVERGLFDFEYRQRRYKMDRLLDDLKQSLGEESFNYLAPKTHIVQGTPERVLPKAFSNIDADLVVMGTVARSGISGVLIGNTAESVLSQLQCAMLAIKPGDFASPVL